MWTTDLLVMTRSLINDLSGPTTQTYDDSRILETIVIGGLLSAQEYIYNYSYNFDLSTPQISPDPTDPNTLETIAMALFTLKAACILTQNNYQTAIGGGIKIRDGDDQVDTTAGFKGYKDIIDIGPCGAYQKLLKYKQLKASGPLGAAISTPFSHDKLLLGNYSFPFWDQFTIR